MRAKIDINEVEVRTKIRAKYLRAMENEEWDLLPGEVYVKSFLRTYGEYLGLDTRQLIDDFKQRYERPTDHELRPIAPLGRERERTARGPLLPPWAIIGLVLVAVVVVLYIVGTGSKPKTPVPLTTRHRVTHRGHHTRHHRAAGRAPAQSRLVKLQLVPTGPVYVCLVNGRGRTLIRGVTYSAGQTIPTERAAKLLLTLGNASIQMKVDGANVPVAASSASIGYELVPGSHRRLPTSAQPHCA
jgi:cytoskeleton protein RodZ